MNTSTPSTSNKATTNASNANSTEAPQEVPENGDSIRDGVLRAILEIAPDLSRDDLDANVDLRSEIGLDSIDLLNIASAIAEETGFEIPEAEISRLHSIGDLIELIEWHCGAPP